MAPCMCHLLFRKGHTSKSVLKRSLLICILRAHHSNLPRKKTTKFKQVSHVWQVEELLSDIQVSLRYWLEEDICDDLSECEMNREAVCARDREGVARTENALG